MTTCITGTGLYIPPYSISNEELVVSFNQYVDNYNAKHADEIATGTVTALEPSSAAFIEKVSWHQIPLCDGKRRYLKPVNHGASYCLS